ncbi:MAG: hypothetical protein ACK6DF_12440 [Betaproteobacteria bacterium]
MNKVAASAQDEAQSALLLLFEGVLGMPLPWLDEVVTAQQARWPPVLLNQGGRRAGSAGWGALSPP